jgi:hypothetical protein
MLSGDELHILGVASICPRTDLRVIFGWAFALALPHGCDCLHSPRVRVEDESSRPTG